MPGEMSKCELCGEPMPPGEEMFKYHGYSGPCQKPPAKPMAHADPLSLQQAREKLIAAIDAFNCTCRPCEKKRIAALKTLDDLLVAASSPQRWVVVVPNGSWTKCYGGFPTYDVCVEWVRANQWHPSDVNIYPIAPPSSDTPERSS